MWQDYTNAFLGLVVFVAAFLGLTGATLVWTFAIFGGLVFIVGLWGGAGATSWAEHREHRHA